MTDLADACPAVAAGLGDEPRETPTPCRPYSVAEQRLLAAQGQRERSAAASLPGGSQDGSSDGDEASDEHGEGRGHAG